MKAIGLALLPAVVAVGLAEIYSLAQERNPRLTAAGALTTATQAREVAAGGD